MLNLETRILPSTAKVFSDECPKAAAGNFVGLRNEIVSFQLAWKIAESDNIRDGMEVAVQIGGMGARYAHIRRVEYVPVRLATYPDADDCYLRKTPGLYPDPLTELKPHCLYANRTAWHTVWIDFSEAECAGEYPLVVSVTRCDTGEIMATEHVRVEILNADLPEQTLLHAKWFHTDSLANYYHVDVFSPEYWRITENFVRLAVKRGINTLLTPIHTPPLDTRVGWERKTVQLVDVTIDENGKYSFGFEKLHRWVEMALRCGIRYFEMAHLYSQWGSKCAPKIVANTPQGVRRIFGWDTPATGDAYKNFLGEYLPALTKELSAMGIADKCIFHISDEPNKDNIEQYFAAKNQAAPYLEGYRITDAMSDFDFYRQGVSEHPLVAINHIQPFLDADVPDLWGYYCCGQYKNTPNVFIAMPGARTRALGAMLYKFRLTGFLQWGFNFYNSMLSDYPIDPWAVSDADEHFPAGDPYQVYPCADGQPADSLRSMLFMEAVQDLRAMQLLESLTDRQTVLNLIEQGLEKPLGFECCPYTDEYVLGLRDKVNAEIAKHL